MGRVFFFFALFLSDAAAAETYKSLQPLIDRSCTPCHASSQRFQIVDYPFVSAVYPSQEDIVNNMIERSVRSLDAEGTMPPKGSPYPRLTADEIGRLQAWIDAGLPRE